MLEISSNLSSILNLWLLMYKISNIIGFLIVYFMIKKFNKDKKEFEQDFKKRKIEGEQMFNQKSKKRLTEGFKNETR